MTEANEAPNRASGGGDSADSAEPLLKLRGIDKHFGPVQALYGVNLDLPAGQVTGLCGDNGAGKSVLTRTIAGVHQPDHGQIYFDGKPVHIRSARDDSMEKQAAQTLSTLRVTTVRSIRQPVASLSGGQRQSVAVAKAVMWNSKLVLLDEPTAALGVVQTRSVLDLIMRLRDRGLAVMVISHNLNDVFEVADRIAVLYLGRMVAEGPTADFDRQSVVEYMTTGTASGRPFQPAASASGEG
jgi:ABC-type sugar transport system ATPase subunit